MRPTFLALIVAMLASFVTTVYADTGSTMGATVALPQARQSVDYLLVALGMPDLARPAHRVVTPANVIGKGNLGEPCHAERPNSNGGTDLCNDGKYIERNGELWCSSSLCGINCHKDGKEFPPAATCFDGAQP